MHQKVPGWTAIIIENVLKELAVANGEAAKKGLTKFKYVGKCHAASPAPPPRSSSRSSRRSSRGNTPPPQRPQQQQQQRLGARRGCR